jgi:hypothetical protein
VNLWIVFSIAVNHKQFEIIPRVKDIVAVDEPALLRVLKPFFTDLQ